MGFINFIDLHYKKLAVIIIVAYAACLAYTTKRLSVTGDERNYFVYAVNVVKGHAEKGTVNGVPQFNSQQPINVFNTIPRVAEQLLHPKLERSATDAVVDIEHGRMVSVLCALLLGFYVLSWATQLYGRPAGIFSLLLYALCPNLMAHNVFVSTDVFSFLMVTATCYHAWRYNVTGKQSAFFLMAFYLGIGQISKQSLLLLYPVLFIFLIYGLWKLKKDHKQVVSSLFKQWAIISLVSLLVINVGFLFSNTGKKLIEYQFVSQKFNSLQQSLSFAGNVPIPLPEPYIKGFDAVSFNVETGPGIDGRSSYGSTYFLGKQITGERIWYYYLVCCLYKLPVPFLIILSMALSIYVKKRKERLFLRNELYLLLPAAFIFLSFSFFNTMYLGIKNIIMILPLLFIFCGGLLSWIVEKRLRLYLLFFLMLWQTISVMRYLPDLIPYTNEFILDKMNAHKVFGDANIYMQEGEKLLAEYLQQHPEVQYGPKLPIHGKLMLSLDSYYDWWNKNDMQWFRRLKLQPVGHLNSQYLLFDLP